MKVVKRFFSSSLFRLYLILLLAILSEAGFYIYALNTNLTPYTIVSIGLTIALVVGGISLFLFYIPIEGSEKPRVRKRQAYDENRHVRCRLYV